MNDLISRQDAISLIKKWSGGYEYIETETESAIKELCEIPSAQPERKTGEWIEIPDEIFASTYKCSECGASPLLDEYEWAFSHYCPNCGARMVQEGEEDETD